MCLSKSTSFNQSLDMLVGSKLRAFQRSLGGPDRETTLHPSKTVWNTTSLLSIIVILDILISFSAKKGWDVFCCILLVSIVTQSFNQLKSCCFASVFLSTQKVKKLELHCKKSSGSISLPSFILFPPSLLGLLQVCCCVRSFIFVKPKKRRYGGPS